MTTHGRVGALACAAVCLLPCAALAQDPFDACIARLEQQAVSSGVSSTTAREVLATVEPLERVIEADRSQPEFVESFASYLNRRVTDQRIARGRELAAEHAGLLERLTAEYGVPGQYIVAFWGLETNYGTVLGNVPVFDALATLACDQRRSEYFSGELVNALRIADRGDLDPARMTGSWAGAMGQTQFMPSAYLEYAVDGDGDGRTDLWTSIPDALTSAARYLNSLGWQSGFRWGREALLPEDFDYFLIGRNDKHPLSFLSEQGLTDIGGRPLTPLDMPASVLLPAGSAGPAFVVYENFDVIMRWNRSESFAIAVGHLADRIAGAGALAVTPPDTLRITREQLAAVQQGLSDLGFESGRPDGILGPQTRIAIRDFQQSRGWVADGFPSEALLDELAIDL